MPSGGDLTIAVRAETIGAHASLSPGDYVSISVSDTGAGMDEQTLARAIDPFFTTKPAGQGTGLGLSMVHGLAAQSGGMLSLQSAVGRGTTATLLLPVSNEPPAYPGEQPIADGEDSDESRITILVVDDEALVRTSTAAMLSEAGYGVREASSGLEALSLVKEDFAIDAVITDYAMPGMDGAQLADALRAIRPNLPILMISGFASLADKDVRGLPWLAKPFRESELTSKVAELIENDTARTG